MNRTVQTRCPSFSAVPFDEHLVPPQGVRWHVVCGDEGHWRAGMYSPPEASASELAELEKHDCPELFLLISGQVTLVVAEPGGTREIALQPGVPVLVESPHSGYCPNGPYTGVAFVVERDVFDTEYRSVGEWVRGAGG